MAVKNEVRLYPVLNQAIKGLETATVLPSRKKRDLLIIIRAAQSHGRDILLRSILTKLSLPVVAQIYNVNVLSPEHRMSVIIRYVREHFMIFSWISGAGDVRNAVMQAARNGLDDLLKDLLHFSGHVEFYSAAISAVPQEKKELREWLLENVPKPHHRTREDAAQSGESSEDEESEFSTIAVSESTPTMNELILFLAHPALSMSGMNGLQGMRAPSELSIPVVHSVPPSVASLSLEPTPQSSRRPSIAETINQGGMNRPTPQSSRPPSITETINQGLNQPTPHASAAGTSVYGAQKELEPKTRSAIKGNAVKDDANDFTFDQRTSVHLYI
jgi:hypothetical protein